MSDYYNKGIEKNIVKINTCLSNFKDTQNSIKYLLLFNQNDIRYKTSLAILQKVSNLTEEMLNDNKSLMRMWGNLRFIFEALVMSKLLLIEKDYVFKAYFSLQLVQIDKLGRMIERIKHEINLLEQLEEKEKNLEQTLKEDINQYISKMNTEMKKLLKQETTIFLEEFETNGTGFQKHLIKTQILPAYESKLNEFQKINTERAKDLAKSSSFNNFFATNGQSSKVFKLLRDGRKWEKKASQVGLQNDYNIIYEMTSSLMHCTSYSLFTSNELDSSETFLIYRMLNQYLEYILESLRQFCEL